MLRWEQLDAFRLFVTELDARQRREHEHDFCGLAYADNPGRPALITVYDPQHMGSFCGCSSTTIPPRRVLSRSRTGSVGDAAPATGERHWWSRLFAGSGG